jgi:hypothetical protein
MQAKYLGIVTLVVINGLALSNASAETPSSCVPPPGFVDTPRPELAPPEELITHTVDVTIERPLAAVLDLNSKTPLRINRSGSLPGVTGIHRLNQGPFQAGARRLVCLTDGSTASEEVLVWERNPDRTRHQYVVWNYTSSAFDAVSYAVGEFVHTAVGDKRTHVRWTYSFRLKPESDPRSFREKIFEREWIPYMRSSIAGKKQRAEEVLPAA